MNLLSLDTSTFSQSVAVWPAGCEPIERTFHTQRGHSPSLLATIAELLGQAGLERNEIDLIAVGLGPGSFTGLRIGLAVAKALCFVSGCEIVGVSSLAALALGTREHVEGAVVTAVDARKREVYAAVWGFDDEGVPTALVDESSLSPATLGAALATIERPLAGVGNGFALYAETIQDGAGFGLEILGEDFWWPRAKNVAELGVRRYRVDGAAELYRLEPQYIRPSDAELNWGRK